jgi:hypothetical protein
MEERKVTKTFILALAALIPFSLFAVDGVVLINQSAVMAAGGFPYTISNPGSYKLSGNLTPPPDKVTIQIITNNVVLDLNGFTVQCSNDAASSPYYFACIFGPVPVHNIAIRNGTVVVTESGATGSNQVVAGVGLPFDNPFGANGITLEDLHIEVEADPTYIALGWDLGRNSIIRHNILSGRGSPFTRSSSLVEGNINGGGAPLSFCSSCVFVNNVGLP